MSTISIELEHDTACEFASKFLMQCLDDDHLPEGREIEFMLACQEVLHFIMIPSEWEKRFEKDFVKYSENADYDIEWWKHECLKERDIMSFPKGTACDWCGITEETYEHNKKTIKRLKQYEEMRNEG
jgi:hypothetical protein